MRCKIMIIYRKVEGVNFAWFLFFSILLSSLITKASDKKEHDQVTDLVEFCAQQKGFNLLGKFDNSWSNDGYAEEEFRLIRELGFNFVRLPVDYRTYTETGDWDVFIEAEVNEIDDAIAWGKKYDVHVCINLHRAPGYCVNSTTLPANQDLDLWTNTEAQNAFVNHWKFFANRYKDIPSNELSFNLVNEPDNVSEGVYVNIMKRAIDTIHAITPERIIFVDALNYGRNLIVSMKDEPNIAQAVHCYDPFGVTHYKAEWVDGSDMMPTPVWPMLSVSKYLYGPWKSEYQSALELSGEFPAGTEIIVNVFQVSTESTLQIKTDKETILSKKFVCSADTGDDFSIIVENQWGFQNISNKDFSGVTTEDATILSFKNISGDWMTINSITLQTDEISETYILADDIWGKKQTSYTITPNFEIKASDGNDLLPFDVYLENIEIAKENNIAFMVQEFGVYNKTPHNVTIAFLGDLVRLLEENKVGWALWNFIGSFGILNSFRSDCDYESYEGYQLDSKLLDILTKEYNASENINKVGGYHIFPNPAKNELFIKSKSISYSVPFYINEITGRVIKKAHIEFNSTGIGRIDINGLEPGVYVLTSSDQYSKGGYKFIVQ